MRGNLWALAAIVIAMGTAAPVYSAAPPPTREQIEADWLRQDEVRGLSGKVSPEEDAVGGCDGIKDGKWGFHTALEDNPWWQVDLGRSMALDRTRIYNRCDHTAYRAVRLKVLVSDDGKGFKQVYEHNGVVFYGQPDGKPLVVPLRNVKARYVRIQVPGNNCLNLDFPSIGLTTHDSGRFVLDTVPVEEDGSAPFRMPSGITFFVQALDKEGMAVQTMRSGAYLQPGQTYTCIGCHEQRGTTPPNHTPRAALREPSRLTPGPAGSWPWTTPRWSRECSTRTASAVTSPGRKGRNSISRPPDPTMP